MSETEVVGVYDAPARPSTVGVAVVRFRVTDAVGAQDTDSVWSVYEAVFGDFADQETWRAAVWDKHTARRGFRLAGAYVDGVLVGFAYGYTGDKGQWWTDNASEALDPDVARAWLGGHFELVSLAVDEAARGKGIGRTLMRNLLDGLPHERALLMTSSDPADPARLLCASEGWHVLGPGIGERTVIMGRRLLGSLAPQGGDTSG